MLFMIGFCRMLPTLAARAGNAFGRNTPIDFEFDFGEILHANMDAARRLAVCDTLHSEFCIPALVDALEAICAVQ